MKLDVAIFLYHGSLCTLFSILSLCLHRMCVFCGERGEEFTEESHFLNDCPMLQPCKFCSQVVWYTILLLSRRNGLLDIGFCSNLWYCHTKKVELSGLSTFDTQIYLLVGGGGGAFLPHNFLQNTPNLVTSCGVHHWITMHKEDAALTNLETNYPKALKSKLWANSGILGSHQAL